MPWRTASLFGDDVDHTADRLRAIERALRAAQHFDALDIVGREIGKVIGIRGVRWVVQRHAIHHHQRVVGVRATHKNTRVLPHTAALHQIKPRHIAQQLHHCLLVLAANIFLANHSHRAGNLRKIGRRARRGDDDWRDGGLSECVRRNN